MLQQPAGIDKSYGTLPLLFEANLGQGEQRVKFLSRGKGYAVFLASDEIVIARSRPRKGIGDRGSNVFSASSQDSSASLLGLKLFGANSKVKVVGENRQDSISNYFTGRDRRAWNTKVPNFSGVRYLNIYSGIDLIFYGNRDRLEHDFLVSPYADPGSIKLAVHGAKALTVNKDGDLVMATSDGDQRLLAPQIYQEKNGVRVPVSGRYVLVNRRTIGFQLGSYDRSKALVIDPVLVYSSYLGASGEDAGQGIAVDVSGNAYITGYTFSASSLKEGPGGAGKLAIGKTGGYDVFVAKLNASGSALTYCTYLGGSGDDLGHAIAVDSSGNAYVAGETSSPDFPVLGGMQPQKGGGKDGFVAKLDSSGSALAYSTYLGGSKDDAALAIAVDRFGGAHVAGYTLSADFPTAAAVQPDNRGGLDAFVSDINAAGSAIKHSTYLGGSREDAAQGIAIDPTGNAYITGYTFSSDFPVANPLIAKKSGDSDAFVVKMKASDSTLGYSTFLGGSRSDLGRSIAVDQAGNAFVTGQSESSDFPVRRPIQAENWGGVDSFVTKLVPSGSALSYSTYLGGGGVDISRSIAVDSCGNAHVTGLTNSDDFLLVDELQSRRRGGYDAFVSQIDASGDGLSYSTFLGGKGEDAGLAIATDSSGNAYVSGHTRSDDFPAGHPPQATNGGGTDGFVTKISSTASCVVKPHSFSTDQGKGATQAQAKTQTLVAAGSQAGGTYFVANSGNDSNSGTSSTAPWKTLGKVNAQLFAPGDTISFNRGDVWNAQTDAALIVSSSGIAGAPITFSAYGSGNLPVIDGQNAVAFPVQTNSKSFIAIDSLQVQNASNIAIYVNNCDTCSITNSKVMNGLNYGISVAGNSPNATITGNTYSLSASFGMVGTALDCNTDALPSCTISKNAVDLRNVASANHPSGIICRKSGTCTIAYNTISMANGSQGIGLKANGNGNMTGSQVIGNSIVGLVYTPSCPAGTCDAEAIEVTGADTSRMVTNSLVSGNYVKNGSGTSSSCIGMYYSSSSNVVSYNLCIAPAGTNQNACVHATSNTLNNLFYNNSCYGAVYGMEFIGASVTGNTIKNNVVVGARRGIGFYTGATGNFDYNDVWNTLLKTYEGGTDGGHNLVVDPKWTSSTPTFANDFKLLSDSPLIDSGADLGSAYQMANDPDAEDFPYSPADQNQFGSWERGAFLFKSSTLVPTLDLAPGSITFGNQRVGASSGPSDLTLSNTSTAPLTITAIALVGPDAGEFSTTQTCGSTLAAGSTCAVSVTFSPTSGGPKSASVSVSDNASGSPHTVGLSGDGSAPGVDLAPSSLLFGEQATSSSSSPQSLTLTNNGTETLNIASVEITGPDAAQFSKTQTCGATLAQQATCTVSVVFSPGAAGAKSASLTIADDASSSPQTVSLSGTGTAPGLGLAPASLTFSDQAVNTSSAAQVITLTNSGTQTLHLSGITISGGDSAQFSKTQNCDATLAVNASCTVTVTFTPSSAGSKSASVTVADDAPGSPHSISLSGNGTAAALGLSPFSLSFGNQEINTNSAPQTVTLSNTGNAILNISGIAITGSDTTEFSKTQTCGSSLAANANCTVTVTFSPTGTGGRSATLSISDDATGAPHTVPLTGGGTAPALGSSPSSLSFGNQTVNTVSPPQSITLTNTGSETLNISGIALAGSDAVQFSKSQSCGLTLAVNATCTVTVTFAPTASGTKSASIVVTDDAPGSPHTVALSGAGTAPALSLSAGSLSFGGQPVNTSSPAQSITLNNIGSDALNIGAITIFGSDAAQFSKSQTCGSTLPVNANCAVTVTFTPTGPGSRSAVLNIADDAPGSPQTVPLSGTGTAPALDLSTSAVAFGNQTVGASATPQAITLSNSGSQTLNINGIAITGSDAAQFSRTQTCNATLAMNANCTVTLTFTPNSSGAKTAALTVNDDATGSPHTVGLSGVGTAPALDLSVSSLSFGNQALNTNSASQSVTLTNTGTEAVNFSNISLTGSDFGQFSKTQTCGSSLPIGASCSVSVSFSPVSTGSKTAAISIVDNAGGGAHNVTLSGIGTAPGIGFSPSSLVFGNQTVNTNSTAQVISITNTGNQSLNIFSIAVTGADSTQFGKTQTCAATLPAAASCNINVVFSPTSTGSKAAAITITDDAGGSPHVMGLSGNATAPPMPSVGISATTLDFGNQALGTTALQSIVLTNTGTGPLNISSLAITGTNANQFEKTQTCGGTLAAGVTCSVTVTFSPTSLGGKAAAITIADNASNSPQIVTLEGTGVVPVDVSPVTLNFGSTALGTTSVPAAILVANNKNVALTISSIALNGSNRASFSQSNTCGTGVPAGGSCIVNVVFAPTGTGARSATLVITDNATNSPQNVSLTGTGVVAVTLSPSSLSFGSLVLGSTSSSKSVVLTNNKSTALNIASVTVGGSNPGDFIPNNGCGTSVAPNSACTIRVAFKPNAAGTRTAVINITDDANNSPQSFSLSGSGIVPAVVSPTSLTFASQTVGTTSSAKTINLKNNKTTALNITGIAFNGANRSNFSQTNNCGSHLAANASCTVSVKFSPSAKGTRNATLSISDDASNSPQAVVLTGTGK